MKTVEFEAGQVSLVGVDVGGLVVVVVDEDVVDEDVGDEDVIKEVDDEVDDDVLLDEVLLDEVLLDEVLLDEVLLDEVLLDEVLLDEEELDEMLINDEEVDGEVADDEVVKDDEVVGGEVVDDRVVDEEAVVDNEAVDDKLVEDVVDGATLDELELVEEIVLVLKVVRVTDELDSLLVEDKVVDVLLAESVELEVVGLDDEEFESVELLDAADEDGELGEVEVSVLELELVVLLGGKGIELLELAEEVVVLLLNVVDDGAVELGDEPSLLEVCVTGEVVEVTEIESVVLVVPRLMEEDELLDVVEGAGELEDEAGPIRRAPSTPL
ncbi:hypothetical protein B0A50_07311 [Salinomyces thailandicus]|uniref:Uncharacterized protein n=1 Tax=Salinomyces thailandicus TaxID=706561 RepID=A0A4U0TMS5_9PEZI|nr:hypothetical protein B0A50_07311 [Salinomyces thailandica]